MKPESLSVSGGGDRTGTRSPPYIGRRAGLEGGHRLDHTGMVIRLGVPADLAAVAGVYRSASLSNAGDRGNLLAHPEYLIMGPEGLAEGRTHVAEEDGSVIGFATWALVGGTPELADLFVDPGWMRRGIATALVGRIADVLRSRGVACLEVTANPHARGFYRAAGFIDCGVAETAFGSAPRMLLAIRLPPLRHERYLALIPQPVVAAGGPGPPPRSSAGSCVIPRCFRLCRACRCPSARPPPLVSRRNAV